MKRFVIIVNRFQPLTIITKCSILDDAAVIDPPLAMSVPYNDYVLADYYLNWIINVNKT